VQHYIRPRVRQCRRRIAADDHTRICGSNQRAKVTANLLRVEVDCADDFNSRTRQG
jgi:hypothetical protein